MISAYNILIVLFLDLTPNHNKQNSISIPIPIQIN